MYTIVTVCPHCSSYQLADGLLIHKQVRCSKCGGDFACAKKLGPILWVREAKMDIANGGFEKVVSRVLFTYGLAVPPSSQSTVLAHMGITMSLGMTRDVVMHIGPDRYPACMTYFEDKKGEPKLHFKWKMEDTIALALKNAMPKAYAHFVINRNKDFLAGVSVVVTLAEKTAEFNLEIRDSNDKKPDPDRTSARITARTELESAIHNLEVRDLLQELGNV